MQYHLLFISCEKMLLFVSPLFFSFSECFALRQDSRIIGALIGTLAKAPHTGSMSGIPMLLSSEEIDLLLSLNRISLFRFTDPHCFSEDYMNKFKVIYIRLDVMVRLGVRNKRIKSIHKHNFLHQVFVQWI